MLKNKKKNDAFEFLQQLTTEMSDNKKLEINIKYQNLVFLKSAKNPLDMIVLYVGKNFFPESELSVLKKITFFLFQKIDNELSKNHEKSMDFAFTIILLCSVVTHLEIYFSNKETTLEYEEIKEYISTNFVSRSNVTSPIFRIATFYFLIMSSDTLLQENIPLRKMIDRYGQTLLEDVFCVLFEKNEKKEVAFSFLQEYMGIFFILSNESQFIIFDVLKKYMLKYPEDFLNFFQRYIKCLEKNPELLFQVGLKVASLLKLSLDIHEKKLISGLSNLLTEIILDSKFTREPKLLSERLESILFIIQQSKSQEVKIVIQNLSQVIQIKNGFLYLKKNKLSFSLSKSKLLFKLTKIKNNPSVFDLIMTFVTEK
ncbi:MAG: hypothetical protein K2X39_03740 [Silvanigrellaceae bacterium]|nr:hypothetical protein [Silvanigrellaceae bacterium]